MASELPPEVQAFLASSYFNNTINEYVTAFLIFLASILIMLFFKFVIIKRIQKFAEKTKTEVDDLIIKILDNIAWPFYAVLAIYVAEKFLVTPPIVDKILYYAIIIVMTFYAAIGVGEVINYALKIRIRKKQDEDSGAIEFFGRFLKGIVWVIAVLLLLDNFGYDITTLIAGLGIGGIAIAFALQNVLEDVFASFSIHYDKPFVKGDLIVIGQDTGTVEKIGIKSTRVRTLQGQELVVSNRELTTVRVNNFKKMEKRRIVFNLGVTYDTPVKKLERIPNIIKKIITDVKLSEFDRCHFKSYGDFSLDYEIVYFVKSKEYLDYINTQQDINLKIKKAFEKEKIEFAFPTQTIHVAK